MEMCSVEASSVLLRFGNSEFPAGCVQQLLLLPSTLTVRRGAHGFSPLLQLPGVQETQLGDFPLRLFLVFSTEGEKWAQLPCELQVTQSHKTTAHPSFQEHCRTSEEGPELFFPRAREEGPHRDDLMEKRPLGKAPGQSVPGGAQLGHPGLAPVPSGTAFCTLGLLNHILNHIANKPGVFYSLPRSADSRGSPGGFCFYRHFPTQCQECTRNAHI